MRILDIPSFPRQDIGWHDPNLFVKHASFVTNDNVKVQVVMSI